MKVKPPHLPDAPVAPVAGGPAGGGWSRTLWLIAVGAIFTLALGARLYCLDCYSLWMDEVDSIALAQRGLGAIFGDRFGMFAEHTPWHYLMVWLTIQPLDPTMTSVLVRLPAALAGALLVPLVFAWGASGSDVRQGCWPRR